MAWFYGREWYGDDLVVAVCMLGAVIAGIGDDMDVDCGLLCVGDLRATVRYRRGVLPGG